MVKVRVFDNKGKSFDRYTAIIDGRYYGMSTNALSPDGFNQYGGEAIDLARNEYGFFNEAALGREVKNLETLPEEVKKAIAQRKQRVL